MASFNFRLIRNHVLLLVFLPLAFMAISFVNAKSVIATLEANLELATEVQAPAISYLGTMNTEVAKLDKWINKAIQSHDAFKIYEADIEIRKSIEKMDEALASFSEIPVDETNIEQILALKHQWSELRQIALESLANVENNNADVAAIEIEEKYEPLNKRISLNLEGLVQNRLQSINSNSAPDTKMPAEGRNMIMALISSRK